MQKSRKKFIVEDTGAGYAGKMLSMAKKFGLKCKIFMGAKDIRNKDKRSSDKKMGPLLCLLPQEAKHWLMLLVNV